MDGGNDSNNTWEAYQTFQKMKKETKFLSGTETKSEVLRGRIYRTDFMGQGEGICAGKTKKNPKL